MALTSEQEAKVLEIIKAFDNGKRLNELPTIGTTNPLDLIVEVLDTDGESKQAKLAALLPYLEEQCAYGVERTKVGATTFTRVGNLSLHKTLPIQSRMKGCLLDDNGKPTEYLSPYGWEGHTRDGSRGQVMVEIPDYYVKHSVNGTTKRTMMSEYPLPGYRYVPKMYISAYEATFQRSTGKLCSVVNATADYRGGNNQADWDGTYRSQLGRPTTAKSRTQFRAAARLRKSGSTEWNEMDYTAYLSMCWLYYVEYANTNCQLAFNAQKDANGYAQGGLGNGVTTMGDAEWSALNSYYPLVPCGHTDSLGNGTGEIPYEVKNSDGSTLRTVMVPRYRGIENPFGHIWKWTDGINVKIQSEANGGRSEVYVCTDPSKYNDSNYDGYGMRGLEARTNGYVLDIIFGEFGDIMPSEVGGGSTTYWADYHYTSVPDSGEALRGVLFGGAAHYGAPAGFASAYSNNAPSTSNALIGSRLCFLPQSI